MDWAGCKNGSASDLPAQTFIGNLVKYALSARVAQNPGSGGKGTHRGRRDAHGVL